jgi:hypothetical protein
MSHLPANWMPPERPKPPRSRNSIVPAVIAVACSFVLLGGSAFGTLATCSYSGTNPWFGFFAGLSTLLFVVFVIAVVWLVTAAIVAFFRSGKDADS